MGIQILGGVGRSLSLFVLDSDNLRPTSVMLRRKIFDANQDMSDANFIDLCAGTGAMGLEAFSRGASQVVLIEKDPKIFKVLLKNRDLFTVKLGTSNEIAVKNIDTLKWLAGFIKEYQEYDQEQKQNTIIFLDPPYESHNLYHQALEIICGPELNFIGSLWLESDNQKGFKADYWQTKFNLKPLKNYTQGTSYIIVCDFGK